MGVLQRQRPGLARNAGRSKGIIHPGPLFPRRAAGPGLPSPGRDLRPDMLPGEPRATYRGHYGLHRCKQAFLGLKYSGSLPTILSAFWFPFTGGSLSEAGTLFNFGPSSDVIYWEIPGLDSQHYRKSGIADTVSCAAPNPTWFLDGTKIAIEPQVI